MKCREKGDTECQKGSRTRGGIEKEWRKTIIKKKKTNRQQATGKV